MTRKGATPAAQPSPKRTAGYLICETCQRAVAYQGIPDAIPGSDSWPLHRCGLEVRGFDRFELTDPFRSDLPPAVQG